MKKFNFIIVILLLSLKLQMSYGYNKTQIYDSTSGKYWNDIWKDEISDVPWIIHVDSVIPFLFLIKDSDANDLQGLHCIAIYDISDGQKRYEINGTWYFTPQPDNYLGILRDPPLRPNPTHYNAVPNQVFYRHYGPRRINQNWWYVIIDTFYYIGCNWSNTLNGQPITAGRLGYSSGQIITFRVIILGEDDGYDDVYHTQDFRVKVTDANPPLPKLPNWYLVDCHTHGWNTDDIWEYGAPTKYQAIANKRIGLDAVIITDHSNDLDETSNWNDGWNPGQQVPRTGWNHLGWEVEGYWFPPNILRIRGEEVSAYIVGGSPTWPWDERHFLAFNLYDNILGDHPLQGGVDFNVNEVLGGGPPPNGGNVPLNNVRAQGGFAYLAHLGSDYYWDDLTTHNYALGHSIFRGFQCLNTRKTHLSDGSGRVEHPWGENTPHLGIWEHTNDNWDSEWLRAIERWDYHLFRHLNPSLRKIFNLGGSDAHGGFNYSPSKSGTSGAVFSEATTAGCVRTAVYSIYPPQNYRFRDAILEGIKNGRSVVTDGPMLIFGIDRNGDGDINDPYDLMIGDGDDNEDGIYDKRVYLSPTFNPEAKLYFKWQSNQNFGEVCTIWTRAGWRVGNTNYGRGIINYVNGYSGEISRLFTDLNLTQNPSPYFIRAEAYSRIGCDVGQNYRCYTNPIWIYLTDNFTTTFTGRHNFESNESVPYHNYILYSSGVDDHHSIACGAESGVTPYSGYGMYKITGIDSNSGNPRNDYIAFKLFDCNIPITNTTFLSFWLYVKESPSNLGHIILQGKTGIGTELKDWTRYGHIIDQNGKSIHPAVHRAPQGCWVQYIFNLAPAAGQNLRELILIYDDGDSSESGRFTAYIDNIEILNQFPLVNTWYPEIFGNGPPGDPNFELGFDTTDYWGTQCNGGARIAIDNGGNGGEGDSWINPPPAIRKNINPNIPIGANSTISWRQYDKAHALCLSLLIRDASNQSRWLIYAKNAANHWGEQGYVNMGDQTQYYNQWQSFTRNLYDDYTAEYSVRPDSILELRISHFAFTSWIGDHGGVISNIQITKPFFISNFPELTAFNNTSRVAFDGQKVHLAFRSNWEIYYTYSVDQGNTWQNASLVNSGQPGSWLAPALALDAQHRPHVIWGTQTDQLRYWHSYYDVGQQGWVTQPGMFSPPDGLQRLNQPSFVILRDTGYLVINTGNKIYYGQLLFDSCGGISGKPIWECVESNNIVLDARPSIVCDRAYNRKVIAYVKNRNGYDNIYMSFKIGQNNWSSPILVSENMGEEYNNCPNISVDGAGNIYIVWLGNYAEPIDMGDVFVRTAYPSGDSYILRVINQLSSGYDSKDPVGISGNTVVWSQGIDQGSPTEIFYSIYSPTGWGPRIALSTHNSLSSNYPQGCIIDIPGTINRQMFAVWTEGYGSSYHIMSKSIKLSTYVTSDMATGPNNGTHLMRVPNSKELYMVFQEQNRIYLLHSFDEGENWETEEIGEGLYPCLGLNYKRQPWIAYTIDGDLMCKIRREDGSWKEILIFDGNENLWAGPPSMQLATGIENKSEYAYITYAVYEGTMPDGPREQPPANNHSYIYITLFDTLEARTHLIDEGPADVPVSHPCVGVTPADLIHIAWQQKDEIWYITNAEKVTPENWKEVQWTPKYNLSNTSEPSEHPFVESYGDIVSVVWKEGNPGEVIRKERYVWKPSEYEKWSDAENMSNSPDYDSDYPQMSTREVVLWQEEGEDGNYKVYANICGEVLCLTPEANNVSYVHTNVLVEDPIAPQIQIMVYYCYTDEITDGELFEVKFDKYLYTNDTQGEDEEMKYYEGVVGEEVASPYCELRTGYIDYGDYTIDYGNQLEYKLKYLDPCKHYQFQAIVYQDTTGTIRQKLEVEDTLEATMRVYPAEPETINIFISPNSYKEDLESALEIIKTRGPFATIAEFKVYEYEVISDSGGSGSGPQSAGIKQLPIPTMLHAPKPNPFTNLTQIRFQIPIKTKVELKVYNSAGRLVNALVDDEMNPGYYTMNWTGKDNQERICANGIYFVRLKTKDYDMTKKMVLVR